MQDDKNRRDKIKDVLERQRKMILSQIERIKSNDPFSSGDRSTSNEAGDDVSEIEGHDRSLALRQELSKMLDEVKKALSKVGVGTYGKCENCGLPIEPARLQIKPMATLCMSCEMKKEKGVLNR